MPNTVSPIFLGAVDEYVKAFEAAWVEDGQASIESFLPPSDLPVYRDVVLELIRVDLEFGWSLGRPRPLDDYRRTFADVLSDEETFRAIAFEEYRQRREGGENPSPDEYARRYGIDTTGWPAPYASGTAESTPATELPDDDEPAEHTIATHRDLAAASLAYRQLRQQEAAGGEGNFNPARAKTQLAGDALDLFCELHDSDPEAAERLAAATLAMPEAGRDFVGFHLVEELGRGAFGRVFLAHQGDLANRPVALKVSTDLQGESQTLAQLQHTNIVPIYSVHWATLFQAVCMPYLGGTTLFDVIRGLRAAATLPASGKHLVSTLNGRKSRTREAPSRASQDQSAGSVPAQSQPTAAPAEPRRDITVPKTILDRFEGFSYVEAVLWMGARLADGLAHAHERGIVHRDLKPANVLLTDEGQPMLLDFNLSEDTKLRSKASAARMGGTLPYMSPEQLAVFQGGKGAVDARTDLYSLGLILYELLTGKHPFPHRPGPMRRSLPAMTLDRIQPPELRPLNGNVTPAVESIVRKCLEPDPAKRYQSARELQEDLERQLAHQRLKYAPDPSPRERLAKWARRHPRLSSSTTIGAAAAVVLLAGAAGCLALWEKHKGLVAREQFAQFERARLHQHDLINFPDSDTARRAITLSHDALTSYGAVDDPRWDEKPLVAYLEPEARERLRRDVASMMLIWSEAERKLAEREAADERAGRLHFAWRLTERAEACLGGPDSRTLWQQRAGIAELLGRPDAPDLAKKAAALKPQTAGDHYELAREYLKHREFRKAMPELQLVTQLEPSHFWAWLYLGHCYHEQLMSQEALVCYSACEGLIPDRSVAFFPYYYRALIHMSRGRIDAAEADLDRAIALLPALPPVLQQRNRPQALLRRAEMHVERKNYPAADKLLTDAIESSGPDTQLLLARANVRRLAGDQPGAQRDREEGLRREPDDEMGWNARGLARLADDPKGALADFDAALKLNPRFHLALQNKAHVLSERLGKEKESLEALNRVIELYPGYVQGRIGRGVLLARLGRRREAHADAVESLARDRSAATLYQAANIYALTSRQQPKDWERVIPLLAAALWNGFGLDVIDQDGDMDPVRNQPGFKQIVEVVREFKAEVQKQER